MMTNDESSHRRTQAVGMRVLLFVGVALTTFARGSMAQVLFPAAPAGFDVGPSPAAIVLADFDDDGIDDLAVANAQVYGQVVILLGNPAGRFVPRQIIGVDGYYPVALAADDLDGDAILDLVVAHGDFDRKVALLFGVGDGTFIPPMLLDR